MTNELDFDYSAPLHSDVEGLALALEISPTGRIHLASVPGHSDLSPSASARISETFERGSNHGLLHLGAVELATWLPSSLAFGRELAHLFMARLCAVPDLANQWECTEIAPPLTELEKLLASIPLMMGAEYLDGAGLEILWNALQAAARTEIADENRGVQAWLQRKHPSWNLVGRVCFHLAENKTNAQAPFAFLATYAARVSQQSRVQHQPLGSALQEYAGAGGKSIEESGTAGVDRYAGGKSTRRFMVAVRFYLPRFAGFRQDVQSLRPSLGTRRTCRLRALAQSSATVHPAPPEKR